MADATLDITGSNALDLAQWIRPGDHVWCGQGAAEPLSLTGALVNQAAGIGTISAFVGMLFSTTFSNARDQGLSLSGYGGIGTGRHLIKSETLQVVSCHYSQIAKLVEHGDLRCDVIMLQLSPLGPDGRHSLGIAHDYLAILARRARVVLAEVNDQVPWTHGSANALDRMGLQVRLHVSRPLANIDGSVIGDVERRIAAHAGAFINDRSVVQPGVGTVPDAILGNLNDRMDLGVHAGLISDSVRKLMECGAVTNAFKETDTGITTTGLAFGSHELYRFINRNPNVALRDPDTTHAATSLQRLSRLVAVNSAVEVDLTGQINAELAGGAYVGAVGGQGDFVRAALNSRGGHSIIALPSCTKDDRSRIVTSLAGSVVTTARSDADIVVTEWGAAQLRGQSMRERTRRLIAIAAPHHREKLERQSSLVSF